MGAEAAAFASAEGRDHEAAQLAGARIVVEAVQLGNACLVVCYHMVMFVSFKQMTTIVCCYLYVFICWGGQRLSCFPTSFLTPEVRTRVTCYGRCPTQDSGKLNRESGQILD